MAGNCSQDPPYSQVFLQEVSVAELVLIGVSTLFCVAVLILFVDKVYFIFRHYGNHGHHLLIRNRSLVLVGIYPVTAVASLLALYIPRSKVFDDFVSTVYLAICLHQFTTLIILYFGGTAQLTEKVGASGFDMAPACCHCCHVFPSLPATKKNLNKLQLLVLQTAILQPIVTFVSVVLWMDDKYTMTTPAVNSPDTYLSAVSLVSTLVAMYGLMVLFRSTQRHLTTHSIRPKLSVLQLVLVANNVQKLVLKALGNAGYPPCRGQLSSAVRADAIHHMLVIAEMCLLATFARLLYRKPIAQEESDDCEVLSNEISQGLCQDTTALTGPEAGAGNKVRSYNSIDRKLDSFSISDSD